MTVVLLSLPSMTSTTTVKLNFSTFLSRVEANKVTTASIDPAGAVTGKLRGGDDYTSQIPTVLDDTSLTSLLSAHHVAITGVGASSSVLDDLLSFLPFLFFIGLFVWLYAFGPAPVGGGDHGHRGLQGQGLRRAAPRHPL